MTMLSIGVEKLLKLTVGVISLDETETWPSKPTMMSYGHGIVSLFDHVMTEIRARTLNSSDYVRGLVAGVDADPVLRPLLAALDRYGRTGRFYNLDMLADSPQPEASPAMMWDEAERATLAEPRIVELQLIATELLSNNEAWDAFYAGVQGSAADSVERLWEMISRVGINHALGVTGATMGWEIAQTSVGHQ
jgi:hypothetical protein